MSLKDDIVSTVNYAKSFGCVLSREQVMERLIGQKNYELGIRNYEFKHQKLDKAKRLAEMLGNKFKNILFIGVTGSVAAEFPKKNDDIDLFIIVRNNTLWMTRFWVRIFVFVNKIPHRKFGAKEQKDEFCFNIWLDESALKLPKNKQNLRNAVDMILMKKVYDKNNIYARFLKANEWAKKWVATPYFNLIKNYELRITNYELRITNYEFKIKNYELRITNLIYFLPQYIYLKLKCRGDVVDLHRAMWGNG